MCNLGDMDNDDARERFGMLSDLWSTEVVRSEALPTTHFVFFRRPRSKSKRIIRKWRKRQGNWRTEPLSTILYVDESAFNISNKFEGSAEIPISLPSAGKKPYILCNSVGFDKINTYFGGAHV